MASAYQAKKQISLRGLINPTAKQDEFLKAIAEKDYVLYGGAAGGGKSYILRWWLVLFLVWLYRAKGLRNVQVGLFSEDYPSLYDRQISKIMFEFPAQLGELKQGVVKNFQLREEHGGGVIALRNLDDPSKYQSAEFAAIAVDELTKNPKDKFDFLRSRLRWTGVDNPKFAAGANPGGLGHAWVKKFWITKEFPAEMSTLKEQFAFVQSKASDNPHLTSAYYDSLLSLPPDMAKMFAEGSWDIFAGQYFDNFNEAKHTYRTGEIKIEPWWPKWISGDWGFKHPGCIHWHAQDGDRTITYRELYGSGMSESEWAQAIISLSKDETIKSFFYSPDAFAQRTSQNTIAEEIGEHLREAGLPYPSLADNDRIGGWRLMHQLLDARLWTIDRDTCPQLVKCLPTLIRDDKHPGKIEDVLKVDHTENQIGDDPADSARYGLKTKYGEAQVPIDIRVRARLESLPAGIDMSQKMLHREQIIAEERKHTVRSIKLRRPSRWRN